MHGETVKNSEISATVLQHDAYAEALLGSVVKQWIYLLMDKPRAYAGHQMQLIPSKPLVIIKWREDNIYFILVQFYWWSCPGYTVYLPEDSCMLRVTVWHIHVKSHSCINQKGKLYVRRKSHEFKMIHTQHRCYIKTVTFNVCIYNQIDGFWTGKFQTSKETKARKYKTCVIGLVITPHSREDEFLAPKNNHL